MVRIVMLALFVVGASLAPAASLQRFEFTEIHMGSAFRIVLYAPNTNTAERAASAAFDRVNELATTLTDYSPRSELMQLCQQPPGAPRKVSPPICDVLQRALRISAQTEGAFDITVGPLIKLWREARKTRVLPKPETIAEAKQKVGYKQVKLGVSSRTVTLLAPGVQLDLGGIAKGYSADKALAVLRQHGIRRAMVAASGDIALGDPPPGKTGWRIGIGTPDGSDDTVADTVLLHNAGVSTSGDAEQYVEIAGNRYSHIVDPKTGLGLTERIQVTVIAPNATTSDAMATGLCVLGSARALKLADALPGLAAYIIKPGPKGNEVVASRRFAGLMAPKPTRRGP
jgi:thiamine biosynthesis lipoprotein